MAISLDVADKLRITVAGTLKDAGGSDKPFSFWLQCKRLMVDEIGPAVEAAKNDKGELVYADFMAGVIEGWGEVKDKAGAVAEYTESGWRDLAAIPGIAKLAHDKYVAEVGAKSKN